MFWSIYSTVLELCMFVENRFSYEFHIFILNQYSDSDNEFVEKKKL